MRAVRIDEEVAALAARQYGLASVRQIRELGGDDQLIRRRLMSGRWERVKTRVIRIVGTPQSSEQSLMASVLQAGPTGLASHEGAAWVWHVPGFTETSVVLRSRPHGASASEGHRPKLILPHHRTVVRNIPCTTLPRTLFDLAGVRVPTPRLRRVTNTIVAKSPAVLPALHTMLDELSCQGRTGISAMREILAELPLGCVPAATGLELRFGDLCCEAGIDDLERQVDVGGHSWLGRLDYMIRRLRLPIEVDSLAHHTSPLDGANDERRDAEMIAAGWRRPLRVYEEEIWYRPWVAVNKLRQGVREAEAELGPETLRI